MVPVISSIIGGAFWAGLLATAGSLAGMGLSDAILMRLEARESGAPTGAAYGAQKNATVSVSKDRNARGERLPSPQGNSS